jgi:hypothetical protein
VPASRLRSIPVRDWPPLAWLAVCSESSNEIRCFTGSRVELADDQFSEAVWAGPYAEGGFDETDLVFGTGGRIRADAMVFVSSGSTVDRLYALQRENRTWISNSLPCLMSVTDGSLDLECVSYGEIFNSIRRGVNRYAKELPTTVGPVRVSYFENLVWDGSGLVSVPKPGERRDFGSYARYRAFLDSTMTLLAANAAATDREHPYTLISTVSGGYDSSAVTALARIAGCDEAIGFDRARGGAVDSGEHTAACLGVRFHSVETAAWRDNPHSILPFLAAGTSGGSSVFFRGAEPLLAGRVVLTGFHGDKVWSKHTTDLGPELTRGDTSGTDLTEYRLVVGFIHCPVPFWGARQIRDVNTISNSPELEPWDVPGRYSRPICRRIVEECGVPREIFGVRKEAASQPLLFAWESLVPEARREYLGWLRARRWSWIRRRRLPPMPNLDAFMVRTARLGGVLNRLRDKSYVRRLGPYGARILDLFVPNVFKPRRLHRFVFHWALDRAKENYSTAQAVPAGVDIHH